MIVYGIGGAGSTIEGDLFTGVMIGRQHVMVYSGNFAPNLRDVEKLSIFGSTISFDQARQNEMDLHKALTSLNDAKNKKPPIPVKVIINGDATIVFFSDKTKEVAIRQYGDVFDFEKAFAICCAKRVYRGYKNFNEMRQEFESINSN